MRKSKIIVLAFFSSFVFSCEKDPPLNEPGLNATINLWTLDQMKHYYYWNDKIGSAGGYQQKPDLFFKSILYPEDHFSTILQTLNSDTYGNTLTNTFGFDMVQLHNQLGSIQLVTQVVPFSEADLAGLQRGDSLTHMNSTLMDQMNFQSLLNKSLHLPTIQVKRLDGRVFNLPSSYISQPVVYTSKVISSSPNVGYIFISQFDFSGAYSLLEVIKDFKSKHITELIVDLRYNPGGQVAFASFCALLMADVKENYIFAKYRGNKNLKPIEDTFEATLQRQPDGYSFIASEVLKQGLQLKRIFILTGPNTASASEMMINGLNPYLQIVQVGARTYGKDMASTTISTPEEIRGNERSWHLIPMIYKIYNTIGQGDYGNGITPQKVTDEFAYLPLAPIGDRRDALIQEALKIINTKNTRAKNAVLTSEKMNTLSSKYIGSSYQTIPIEVSIQDNSKK